MTQRQLDRAVARATGESIATITGMGFVPLRTIAYEREPLVIDWDEHDQDQRITIARPRRQMALA